jgi:hypothetical protein
MRPGRTPGPSGFCRSRVGFVRSEIRENFVETANSRGDSDESLTTFATSDGSPSSLCSNMIRMPVRGAQEPVRLLIADDSLFVSIEDKLASEQIG